MQCLSCTSKPRCKSINLMHHTCEHNWKTAVVHQSQFTATATCHKDVNSSQIPAASFYAQYCLKTHPPPKKTCQQCPKHSLARMNVSSHIQLHLCSYCTHADDADSTECSLQVASRRLTAISTSNTELKHGSSVKAQLLVFHQVIMRRCNAAGLHTCIVFHRI